MVKVDNIYIKKGRKFITYTCQKHGQIEQREDHFKRTNKWIMAISKGREYYSGYYGCEIEAAMAYDKKALELFGEFAYLNFKIK